MSLSNTAQLLTVIAVLGAPLTASAFSTFAGSCKHAGVNHGLDKFEAQRRAMPPAPPTLALAPAASARRADLAPLPLVGAPPSLRGRPLVNLTPRRRACPQWGRWVQLVAVEAGV